MNRTIKTIILMVLVLLLYTCAHHHSTKSSNKQTTYTVTAQPLTSTLYYSGIIQPLKIVVVTTPTDGVISDMAFHYGDEIKSGQLLFSIFSDKFQSDYKTALMQYIKAKTDFINGESQMREGQFLHHNQLISDDDFKAKQTNYYNAQLALVQAKDTLDNMLKHLDLHGMNLYDLKIEEIGKITQLLHNQIGAEQIRIFAPANGIVLLPSKDEGSDGELKKIAKGDQIKQGDVLAVIGDVSGLTIHVSVNEFNVNQLKVGQKVHVTGNAFPDFTLDGEISAIHHQGETSQGGLPTFPVDVIVPKLTLAEQAVIQMGMSAKVAIDIGSAPVITIPLQAVLQKNGGTFVNVKDEKTGKIREIAVKTGQTTMDSVVIESSLALGEKIVIPH